MLNHLLNQAGAGPRRARRVQEDGRVRRVLNHLLNPTGATGYEPFDWCRGTHEGRVPGPAPGSEGGASQRVSKRARGERETGRGRGWGESKKQAA